jgi:hypothetical protein
LPLLDPAVDPAVDPPVVLEDAPVVELEDEHAAVRASSMTAAAPAVGTTKNRFILAPSRESGSAAGPGNDRARIV